MTTWTDWLALTNAVSAALLGGLAFGYARWVHREGNGQRRWMAWLGPIWGTVALYHSAIWTADSLHPEINTVPLMRPCSWLLLAIPALVLLRAIIEDRRHRQDQHHDKALLDAKARDIERLLNGKP